MDGREMMSKEQRQGVPGPLGEAYTGPTNFPQPGTLASDAVAELSEADIQMLAEVFSVRVWLHSELHAYDKYDLDDLARYAAIRAAAKNFAMVVLLNAPKCADRSAAIREIRVAMMTANAAIALKGKI